MPIFQARNLAIFYRELASLVGSGITIIEAVDLVSAHVVNLPLKQAAVQIKQSLLQGVSLGDAFIQCSDVFPGWQANIIKYSETSGKLASGLEVLADYLEKDLETQQHIIAGLAYPVLLLHVAMFLLPVVNGFTCGIGSYFSGVLQLAIPLYGTAALLYYAARLKLLQQYKFAFDAFLLSIPVFGNIIRQIAVTRFIRALQCLCGSGVGIIGAWRMASEASGNESLKSSLLGAVTLIEKGELLSRAFIQSRVFDSQMIGLITAAEKSGSIVSTLNTIANYLEKGNQAAISTLTKIIPVFVYLAIAGYIGLRIISFYTTYFNKVFSF